ncbi:MAG TPA: acyl-[ACP]--phospholipid O-acyltransferase [Xanthobacteraceae bacterium]|jgi:acyl-[acyl-carrier-protein]-phospholipid O-acyltransferase/long-chain-fatty-acid--[acyl-carrier-protein] ligase|nr:acyl-[ACP]--phospholipid O-acyltransferase [Xanthobacteraceae bacterium]
MSISLMTSRRFAPLFWCQFFAAFGDNFLKTALVFVILYEVSGANSGVLITLAGATLIAPFFFLSGLGGELADRYDKSFVAQRVKLVEIGAAVVGVAGFAFHSLSLLFVAVFMFGTLASLFGPVKYGILPDLLPRRELPSGNALIEGGTFLAILLGTIVAGLAANGNSNPIHFAWLMIATALASWLSSLVIPKVPAGAPDLPINRNIFVSTGSLIGQVRADPRLLWGAIVASWFWLVGALVLSLLPPLVSHDIGGTEGVVTLFLTIFSVAVAVGSGLAAWLAAGRIVLLPTLVGAVLIGLFALDLGWTASALTSSTSPIDVSGYLASPYSLHIAIDLAGLAIAGGLFIVPVFTAVQVWAGADRRARVVAAVNVFNAAFMVVGALILAVLQKSGFGTPVLFALLGAASLLVAVAIAFTMPANWLIDFLSIVFRAFFRLEVKGLENIAKAGHNAIIVLNHTSFLDAPLAVSILPKRPVFAIDVAMSQRWWIQPFLKFMRTMALDPLRPFSVRDLINAVRDGNTMVIFPEGRITVTGSLMKVYDGAAMIADKSGAMVVPVRIDGPEATYFSRLKDSQVRRRLFPKITVTVLDPVKLEVDPELKGRKRRQAAGAALYTIMSEMIFRTTSTDRTVVQALIDAAKAHGPHWLAVEDPVRGQLTYKKLLIGISVLGRKLMPLAPPGRPLGVMLPTSNGAVVTLFAVMSAGRVPAMINFTAGAANILSACRAADLDTILTSREFVEKARLDNVVAQLQTKLRIVYLEDIRKTVDTFDKLRGLLGWKKPIVARKPDDWAAILFTSGSEGLPKGVVLSHRNILANVAQVAARIDFGREDRLFNVLPVFHSFGLTAGTILPLISGVSTYLYPSPLHYRTVPELVYGICATALFGTDTFLNGYARVANPYDFRSLRYVLGGAEPVKAATRQIYLEKFGLRILEGYGVTECSPVLALNTPMFNKFGTIGRLLPGMEAKLEKVEGVEEGGRLYVKGPNVMLGYLRADNPGVLEAPPDGWHDTGDIVAIDDEGFITIKGRAKRFAKVGGEMISLAAVEMLAAELWPNNIVAVSSIPDPRKGERLIMVTDRHGATRSDFIAYARGKHASELMFPAEIIVLDKLPVLGSGKVDQLAVDKFVREQAAAKAAAAE